MCFTSTHCKLSLTRTVSSAAHCNNQWIVVTDRNTSSTLQLHGKRQLAVLCINPPHKRPPPGHSCHGGAAEQIDLSTVSCQQPPGHNLTRRSLDPPHLSETRARSVSVSLWGGGDAMHSTCMKNWRSCRPGCSSGSFLFPDQKQQIHGNEKSEGFSMGRSHKFQVIEGRGKHIRAESCGCPEHFKRFYMPPSYSSSSSNPPVLWSVSAASQQH